MKNTKYYLAAISAYAVWGLFSLVLKPLHAYSSVDILFYRVFSCAILMLLISALFKRKNIRQTILVFRAMPVRQKRYTVLINISGSVFLTINWFSFIYVLNHVSIKASSLAYLVCPILTTLLAFFILKEKLSRIQWFSVALSIGACLLLSYANLLDIFFATIIGFSYACYLVSQRRNTGFDKFILLTFHIVLSSLILLLFYPAFHGPIPVEPKFYIYIAIIAVAFTIVPLFLNLYALNGINSSTAGMLLNINPIIGFTLATTVYHETISLLQLISYSIIFLAVIIFNAQHIFKTRRNAIPDLKN